jgi:hypothetical protein
LVHSVPVGFTAPGVVELTTDGEGTNGGVGPQIRNPRAVVLFSWGSPHRKYRRGLIRLGLFNHLLELSMEGGFIQIKDGRERH